MSGWWLPVLTLIGAIGLTYLLCLRPMRRGRCGLRAAHAASPEDRALDRQLREARAEYARLRASPPSPGHSSDP